MFRNNVLIIFVIAPLLTYCSKQPTGPFQDRFDDHLDGSTVKSMGKRLSAYKDTSAEAGRKPAYDIADGGLIAQNAYNHPLWLKRRLPENGTISVEVTALEEGGDLKVEAWGDGKSFALNKGAYTASGYVFIFGGWHNTISAIARMNEHGSDRKIRQDQPVKAGKTYHFLIQRKNGHIRWLVDGKPFLELNDPRPLRGGKHAYFAFNNWETKTRFDNLVITPE